MKKTVILIGVLWLVGLFSPLIRAIGRPTAFAKSAVLIDAESGEILYAKEAHLPRGMASTTKVMTALVALEHAEPSALVTVDPRACGVEGSSVYLFPEEQITMEALLYALMLQSANDAAEAIAYAVSGSVEGFVALMNEKAASLGLVATHFDNPHGLDGKTHYTTAYELAMLTSAALENETFREIVATEKKTIPLHNGEASRLLLNHNRMLRDYDDIIGVKTGYTRATGRSLVTAATQNGVTLICVTLNDGNDWADHRALLDYGFSLYDSVTIVQGGEISLAVAVCGASRSAVNVSNDDALTLPLPRDHGEIRTVIELPRFVYAGVEKGQLLGWARFYIGETEIGSVPLTAKESVPVTEIQKNWFQRLLAFLGIGI